MTPEFTAFLVVAVLMLLATWLFVWREDRGIAGIMILLIGAYTAMSTKASAGTEQYFFYLSIFLIAIGLWAIIQGLTNRSKNHSFRQSNMGFLE
jgi:uncharacterized membrane protein YczE